MVILFIGFVCFDQFFFFNEWFQENIKNFCYDFIESGGGLVVNVVWLLGLWGEEVYYIGYLQQDFYGQCIIDEFVEVGVDISQVVFFDDMIILLVLVLVNCLMGLWMIIICKM